MTRSTRSEIERRLDDLEGETDTDPQDRHHLLESYADKCEEWCRQRWGENVKRTRGHETDPMGVEWVRSLREGGE